MYHKKTVLSRVFMKKYNVNENTSEFSATEELSDFYNRKFGTVILYGFTKLYGCPKTLFAHGE